MLRPRQTVLCTPPTDAGSIPLSATCSGTVSNFTLPRNLFCRRLRAFPASWKLCYSAWPLAEDPTKSASSVCRGAAASSVRGVSKPLTRHRKLGLATRPPPPPSPALAFPSPRMLPSWYHPSSTCMHVVPRPPLAQALPAAPSPGRHGTCSRCCSAHCGLGRFHLRSRGLGLCLLCLPFHLLGFRAGTLRLRCPAFRSQVTSRSAWACHLFRSSSSISNLGMDKFNGSYQAFTTDLNIMLDVACKGTLFGLSRAAPWLPRPLGPCAFAPREGSRLADRVQAEPNPGHGALCSFFAACSWTRKSLTSIPDC